MTEMHRPPQPRTDQVHRLMFTYGEPVSASELSVLAGDASRGAVYAAMAHLADLGYAQPTGRRPRQDRASGRPEVLYALTDEGRQNVPDRPHYEVGHTTGYSIRHADLTDFRNQPDKAPIIGDTVRHTESPIPATPQPTTEWPVLTRLRESMAKVPILRAAAESLAMPDPLRLDIEARIADLESALSEAEVEYLAYASRMEAS